MGFPFLGLVPFSEISLFGGDIFKSFPFCFKRFVLCLGFLLFLLLFSFLGIQGNLLFPIPLEWQHTRVWLAIHTYLATCDHRYFYDFKGPRKILTLSKRSSHSPTYTYIACSYVYNSPLENLFSSACSVTNTCFTD